MGRKPIRLLLKRVACRTNLHVAPGGYPGLLRDMHEFVSQDPAAFSEAGRYSPALNTI